MPNVTAIASKSGRLYLNQVCLRTVLSISDVILSRVLSIDLLITRNREFIIKKEKGEKDRKQENEKGRKRTTNTFSFCRCHT